MYHIKKEQRHIPITFYFCRHGETDLNREGVFQGQGVDAPLNAKGREQAKELAVLFKEGLPLIDMGFTSPLKRAHETAQIVWGHLPPERRFPLVVDPLVKEGSFGWAEGKKKDAVKTKIPGRYAMWRTPHSPMARLPGGESQEEIGARGMQFLKDVVDLCQGTYEASSKDEVRIAVFSHAALTRCLLYKMGVTMEDIPNARPVKIVYRNHQWLYQGIVLAGQLSGQTPGANLPIRVQVHSGRFHV